MSHPVGTLNSDGNNNQIFLKNENICASVIDSIFKNILVDKFLYL